MISVRKLSMRIGSFHLDDISFEVPPGAYGLLMGRTGSGKTTLLEAICGLKPVAAGSIVLGDCNVTRLKPAHRGVGYVPQDAALFSTMTVWDHLAFAPMVQRWPRQEVQRRVDELADLLGIRYLLERYPRGLSGGEAQRVSLGRALACRPRVLCLDEPLSALDEETKFQMYSLLKRVQEHTHVTVLHVTHSRAEAAALGDRLLLLEQGAVRTAPLDIDFAADPPGTVDPPFVGSPGNR